MKSIFTSDYSLNPNERKPKLNRSLFNLASKCFKYSLLLLAGFTLACVLAAILGVFPTIQPVLPLLNTGLWRLAAIALCFIAAAVVLESLRN